MKKRDKKIILVLFLVGFFFTLLGVSYAYFSYRYIGRENRLTFGELKLKLTEDENSHSKVFRANYPMPDYIGTGEPGYQFTLENIGSIDASYEVYLDDLALGVGVNRIADRYMRVQLVVDGYSRVDTLSDFQNRLLDYGYLKVGEKKKFIVRLWISNDAPSDVLLAQFRSKVRIQGSQVIDEGFDSSGAEAPQLARGLIPAYYDPDVKAWRKADPYNSSKNPWYDYGNQMWANAITPMNSMYDYYANAPIGTIIPTVEIDSMWVWIPRYQYKYTNLAGSYATGTQELPGGITVQFISRKETSSDLSFFQVPNAFTYDGKSIAGFWAAKFQVGYRSNYSPAEDATVAIHAGIEPQNLLVKPSVYIWKGNTLANALQNCVLLTSTQANTPYLSSEIDSHLFKNSEWGAVSYLSQSNYGKYGNPMYTSANRNIYNNAHSKAGYSTGTPTTSADGYVWSYNTIDDRGNGTGSIGGGASTTGNVTGVYDMNGAYYEYVAGAYLDENGNFLLASSGFSADSPYLSSKYFNTYQGDTDPSKVCDGGVCYGDALSETAGWVTTKSYSFDPNRPWMTRGGIGSGSLHGVFYYDFANGAAFSNMSFRPALVVIGGNQ